MINRQERRRRAREQRLLDSDYKHIRERQDKIDDRVLEVYMIAFSLAMNKVQGASYDEIEPVLSEANRILCSIDGETVTYKMLADELYEKTDIRFEWDSASTMGMYVR